MSETVTRKSQGAMSHQKGLWAEGIAVLYLMSKGYKILRRRYKAQGGEIDIIAKKSDMLVFVEVKARKKMNDGLYAISDRAKARIANAAYHYLSAYDVPMDTDMRFDAIIIGAENKVKENNMGSKWGMPLKHLDNAWFVSS